MTFGAPSGAVLQVAVLAACVSAGVAGAQAQVVGTAGAVNPAAKSAAPGSSIKVIEIGARVVHRERIQTSEQGTVQLLFIDKTSMSIGPGSDLVIDEFVYDPNAGTGRMAATLAKGALRFVGGNTSHTGGANVTTPTATLGIRGGVATVEHRPEACAPNEARGFRPCTFVINHFGRVSVSTGAGTQVIGRPDFGVRVGTDGQATAPARVPPGEISRITRQLTSSGRQFGGAPRRPTEALAVRGGLGVAQRGLDPSTTPSLQPQTIAGGVRAANPITLPQSGINQTIQQAINAAATQASAGQQPTGPQRPPQEPPPSEPPPPPPPPPPPR
jgi:hypothetical protein